MIGRALLAVALTAGSAAGQEQRSAEAAIEVGPNVQVSEARPAEAFYETHAAAYPSDPSRLVAAAIIYPEVGRRGMVAQHPRVHRPLQGRTREPAERVHRERGATRPAWPPPPTASSIRSGSTIGPTSCRHGPLGSG